MNLSSSGMGQCWISVIDEFGLSGDQMDFLNRLTIPFLVTGGGLCTLWFIIWRKAGKPTT